MTLIIPNHGAYGGRNFGANNEKDLYDPLFGKDKNDSSKVEYASYLHDKELIDANSHGKQGDAHLNWVSNAWTGEGKEPGITGQVYRVAGTVAFGTVGLLQKYVLSSLFD